MAAARHDIYNRPEYVVIEAERLGGRPAAGYVSWESGALLVPYLSREVEGDFHALDAMSPYGYSGALFVGESDVETRRAAVTRLWQGMRELGYCSVFLRMNPLLDGTCDAFAGEFLHLTGSTVVVDLDRSNEELWYGMHKEVRRKYRRALEAGVAVTHSDPREGHLDEFVTLYLQTMSRVGATPRYFSFDLDYFRRFAAELGEFLSLVVVAHEGSVVCAAINSLVGTLAQSMLGGTRTEARSLSPNIVEIYDSMLWGREAGARYFNLGGGLGGQHDSLLKFKLGFSTETRPFHTVRAVLNESRYAALVAQRARTLGVPEARLLDSGFFPAYRSGG